VVRARAKFSVETPTNRATEERVLPSSAAVWRAPATRMGLDGVEVGKAVRARSSRELPLSPSPGRDWLRTRRPEEA
jgi:hypothetical protein